MNFARTRGSDWIASLAAVLFVLALALPWYTIEGAEIAAPDGLGVLGTLAVVLALVPLVAPLFVALATPAVRDTYLKVALGAFAVLALVAVVGLVVVPDLDYADFRPLSVDQTRATVAGYDTERSWGALAALLVAAAGLLAVRDSVRARARA